MSRKITSKRVLFAGRRDYIRKFSKDLRIVAKKFRGYFLTGPGGIGKTWLMDELRAIARSKQIAVADSVDLRGVSANELVEAMVQLRQAIIRSVRLADFSRFDEELRDFSTWNALDTPFLVKRGRTLRLKSAFTESLAITASRVGAIILSIDTFENAQDGPIGHWILVENGLACDGVVLLVATRSSAPLDVKSSPRWQTWKLVSLSATDARELANSYTNSKLEVGQVNFQSLSALNKNYALGNPLRLGLAIDRFYPKVEHLRKLDSDALDKLIASEIVNALHNSQHSRMRLGGRDISCELVKALIFSSLLNRPIDSSFLGFLSRKGYLSLSESEHKSLISGELNSDNLWIVRQTREPVSENTQCSQLHDIVAEIFAKYALVSLLSKESGRSPTEFFDDISSFYDSEITKARKSRDTVSVSRLRAEKLVYLLGTERVRIDNGNESGLLVAFPPRLKEAAAWIQRCREEEDHLFDRIVASAIDVRLFANLFERHVESNADATALYKICVEIGGAKNDHLGVSPSGTLLGSRVFIWQIAQLCSEYNGDNAATIDALLYQYLAIEDGDIGDKGQAITESRSVLSRAQALAKKTYYDNRASIHIGLGKLDRNLGQPRMALRQFGLAQQSLPSDKSNAGRVLHTVRTQSAEMYFILGEYERARVEILDAHRIVSSLQQSAPQQLAKYSRSARGDLHWDYQYRRARCAMLQGSMSRYDGRPFTAINHYENALKLLAPLNKVSDQVECLFHLGESCRRHASAVHRDGQSWETVVQFLERAQSHIQAGIDLADEYFAEELLDRGLRRLGRLYHDVFNFVVRGDLPVSKPLRIRLAHLTATALDSNQLFQAALGTLNRSLEIARRHGNSLQELESATEIAFLADDYLRLTASDNGKKNRESDLAYALSLVSVLDRSLKRHLKAWPRPFEYEVFGLLREMERGAIAFELNDMRASLRLYLKSFIGLAKLRGYGRARFRAHIEHLFGNIERIQDKDLQIHWYQEILSNWSANRLDADIIDRCERAILRAKVID